MANFVKVRVTSMGHIVDVKEQTAYKLVKSNPQEYQIVQLAKIVVNPPAEKKNAEVVDIDNTPEFAHVQSMPNTPETILKKRGRPAKS